MIQILLSRSETVSPMEMVAFRSFISSGATFEVSCPVQEEKNNKMYKHIIELILILSRSIIPINQFDVPSTG